MNVNSVVEPGISQVLLRWPEAGLTCMILC